MDFDSAWCPVCNRQILPKRYLVPVAPPPPPSPAPPPSSPQSSPKNQSEGTVRRTKNGGTIRARGGLVHGTGRVRANGTLKPSAPPLAPPVAKPAGPIRHRLVIDQGPLPVYCSDQCQMADMTTTYSGLPPDHDPARASPLLPPVPHNSFSDSDSTSARSSSLESASSLSSTVSIPTSPTRESPSIATLAALYNFPPLPPPFPIDDLSSTSESEPESYDPTEYNSGIMMAARRISALLPKPAPKRTVFGPAPSLEPRPPIPGWTDGSNDWRADVYSFAPPKPRDTPEDAPARDYRKAYKSFAASPHRSAGVFSTLGESSSPAPRSRPPPPVQSPPLPSKSTAELYSSYNLSFSRRAESRSSLSASPSSSYRERPLVHPAAQGKLLVPDVTLRIPTSRSSASIASSSSCSSTSRAGVAASFPGMPAKRRSVRSPLGHPCELAEADEDAASTAPSTDAETVSVSSSRRRRPTVETRSWSYDNIKTYPIMTLPPRKERRVVDGREVEVEVHEERKRLFLFPAAS